MSATMAARSSPSRMMGARTPRTTALRGFARGAKKIVLLLSYPSDEVGNHLVSQELLDKAGVDPYRDTLTKEQFTDHSTKHSFHKQGTPL